jgi:hypothetical protein
MQKMPTFHRAPVTSLGIPKGLPLSSPQATTSAVNGLDAVTRTQISDSAGSTAEQRVKDFGRHGFDPSAGRSTMAK